MRASVFLILVVLTNCTSTKPLSDQTFTKQSLIEHLNAEDHVWVVKNDGEDYRNLTIDSIEETYLLGHSIEADILIVPYTSIERIEKHYYSKVKTFALLAIPVGFGIAAIVAFFTGATF